MNFSKEIVNETLSAKGQASKDWTITEMAKEIDMAPSNLWYYLKTDRKWHVENWLILLNRLGACRIEDDKIIVEAKAVRKLRKFFKY